MDTKICTKCGEEKPATTEYFYRRPCSLDGLCSRCKSCILDAVSSRYHEKLKLDPAWVLTQKGRTRAHYELNKEAYHSRSRAWERNNPARTRELGRARAHTPQAKSRRAAYVRGRKQNDPVFALVFNQRKRLGHLLGLLEVKKAVRVSEALGGDLAAVKGWVESLFLDGMTWKNRGRHIPGGPRRWNADHIIPLLGRVGGALVFDYSAPADCAVAWSYKNIAPLWGLDNLTKHNRVPGWNDIPAALQDICTPRIRALLQKVEKSA